MVNSVLVHQVLKCHEHQRNEHHEHHDHDHTFIAHALLKSGSPSVQKWIQMQTSGWLNSEVHALLMHCSCAAHSAHIAHG
jgi:hypothetical protein